MTAYGRLLSSGQQSSKPRKQISRDAIEKGRVSPAFLFAIGLALRGLNRDRLARVDDAVVCVHIHQFRRVTRQFQFVVDRIGGDDDEIARVRLVRGGAVHRNDAGIARGTDGIRRETFAIGDVVDLDLLVFVDVGRVQQGLCMTVPSIRKGSYYTAVSSEW